MKIAIFIKVEFSPKLKLEFSDYGDKCFIRMNFVTFEIPIDYPRNFKFN